MSFSVYYTVTAFLPRQSRDKLSIVGCALLTFFLVTGCTKKIKFSSREAVDQIQAQVVDFKTVRGRAWVSAKSNDQSISFPAIIAIDRTNPKKPLMRIEGTDQLGATHALLVLEPSQKLIWIDFDHEERMVIPRQWAGIPVGDLPDLLLGAVRLPERGVVSAAGEDGFEVRSGQSSYQYGLSSIDPGPRLVLSSVRATMVDHTVAKGREAKYEASYSKFLERDQFYLPQEIHLMGEVVGGKQPGKLELKINWRERTWNEKIDAGIFTAQ